ncbi:MAG: hypothetical protein HY658_13970 [Actinobacteria bacterium]|nr:hypothetical protein [Actinomycetota bacterium]
MTDLSGDEQGTRAARESLIKAGAGRTKQIRGIYLGLRAAGLGPEDMRYLGDAIALPPGPKAKVRLLVRALARSENAEETISRLATEPVNLWKNRLILDLFQRARSKELPWYGRCRVAYDRLGTGAPLDFFLACWGAILDLAQGQWLADFRAARTLEDFHRLASHHYLHDEPGPAVQAIESALHQDFRDARAHYSLACCLARAGDVEGARTALHAAAAFTRTREQALALLRGIGSGCPNPACRLRGRRGGGNVVLFRRYGPSATPLWRCRVCGRTFSGNRSSVTFRSRLSREEVYGIVAELLEGRTVGEIAASDGGPSEERVRRLALRALEIGPSVVQEVAEGTGRAVADLRAGWRRFARTAGGWAGRS